VALFGENTLVLIVSMVIGTIVGEAIDLDDKINKLGIFLERKFAGKKTPAFCSVSVPWRLWGRCKADLP